MLKVEVPIVKYAKGVNTPKRWRQRVETVVKDRIAVPNLKFVMHVKREHFLPEEAWSAPLVILVGTRESQLPAVSIVVVGLEVLATSPLVSIVLPDHFHWSELIDVRIVPRDDIPSMCRRVVRSASRVNSV